MVSIFGADKKDFMIQTSFRFKKYINSKWQKNVKNINKHTKQQSISTTYNSFKYSYDIIRKSHK